MPGLIALGAVLLLLGGRKIPVLLRGVSQGLDKGGPPSGKATVTD